MEEKVNTIYSDFDANRKNLEAIEEDTIEQQAIEKLIQKAKKK